MYNSSMPSKSELPSTAKLVKSTLLAAAIAAVLLVTVVMPAEYGVDPTGIGKIIGLKKMGEIKVSLAEEAEADRKADEKASEAKPAKPLASPIAYEVAHADMAHSSSAPVSAPSSAKVKTKTDEMKVTLPPNKGTEIKVTMQEGKTVKYSWKSEGGSVRYDVHGDAEGIDYHGYRKGSDEEMEGEITAAFTGNHGWFWRNRNDAPVTITLKTSGEYTAIKRLD
jgi:hypothetical protein